MEDIARGLITGYQVCNRVIREHEVAGIMQALVDTLTTIALSDTRSDVRRRIAEDVLIKTGFREKNKPKFRKWSS